ncbi:inositol 2-dehydrogenase [Halovulum dunhuangense]|uniref:Inositol 2-dehydrogenase n=1 Tax=Halovulum dunhuangense TaxID=1505036 RepID=A0A849L6H5_9RHOB|nr:inositol 2-dehydrogenase [Halovulum dunhuangense]NNU82128.1 inositol 2-dehydrogenase [Halovulum dunhuangense]
MKGISVFGSGRMGEIFAGNVAAHPGARLVSVMNPNIASARKLTDRFGGRPVGTPEEALADPEVEAVIISTPTTTHLEYIEAAAAAGKPILCEKPLDLNLERTDRCLEVLEKHPVPFMLGFNRRFDPQISALQRAVRSGEIGTLTFLMSTSREPAPPPISYVRTSGGYFADATIHDIDLICWIAGERPVEVFATGSCMVDPEIGALGDIDTAMTVMKMPSGALAHVNNCRRNVYGFDQRLEAFGSEGMIQTANQRDDDLIRWTSQQTDAKAPLKHFFLERYEASFRQELQEFLDALTEGRPPSATAEHGRTALAIALACEESRRQGRAIKPHY